MLGTKFVLDEEKIQREGKKDICGSVDDEDNAKIVKGAKGSKA